jgi:glycosyltransferase involved in cell wall biosynthesis
MPRFSVIVPVYNRPDEVEELLAGFARQSAGDFEVVIVEDGSSRRCDAVVECYADRLSISYFYKPNSGPGPTRNYGAERAAGEWLLFLDSDCVAPEGYLAEIERELSVRSVDAFGGPDRAAADFTPLQKAIDYSMTSLLTTGGIRGRRRSADRFFPRSFNMGIRRDVFEAVGGFAPMRFGEDIDLSYRIVEGGYATRLFPEAWVYHKRRSTFRQFFKQIFNSGAARIRLSRLHAGTLKAVHALPAVFTAGCAAVVVAAFWWPWALLAFPLFAVLIFADAAARTRSLKVAALAVAASFIQLTAYGLGFFYALVRSRPAFVKNFYK